MPDPRGEGTGRGFRGRGAGRRRWPEIGMDLGFRDRRGGVTWVVVRGVTRTKNRRRDVSRSRGRESRSRLPTPGHLTSRLVGEQAAVEPARTGDRLWHRPRSHILARSGGAHHPPNDGPSDAGVRPPTVDSARGRTRTVPWKRWPRRSHCSRPALDAHRHPVRRVGRCRGRGGADHGYTLVCRGPFGHTPLQRAGSSCTQPDPPGALHPWPR
jgi:hypothetical protein